MFDLQPPRHISTLREAPAAENELRRMQDVMTMIAVRQGLLPPEEDEAV